MILRSTPKSWEAAGLIFDPAAEQWLDEVSGGRLVVNAEIIDEGVLDLYLIPANPKTAAVYSSTDSGVVDDFVLIRRRVAATVPPICRPAFMEVVT
jgi:hypothetical protein